MEKVKLNNKTWERLVKKYGSHAETLLDICPYHLAINCDIPFAAADEHVLANTGIDKLCPKRIANALMYTLNSLEKGLQAREDDPFSQRIANISGSTCIPKSHAYTFIETLLGLEEDSVSLPMLDQAVKHLAVKGQISVNRIGDQIFLATKRSFTAERDSAERINELLSLKGIVEDKPKELRKMYKAIDQAMATTGMVLSQEQKNAVSTILRNRVSVLTGGPGTGKSATQRVLVKSLEIIRPGASIRCIAPTGMAAMRMSEATGYKASTIHKALGLMPGEIKTKYSLDDDLVLVDESSMLDIFIFNALIGSVSNKTSIVFIGDVAQLPSIAAGNILENLISSKVPTAELTKVFRQGDNSIAFNCAKIKTGETLLDEDDSFSIIERESSDEIQNDVCRIYAEEVSKNGIDSVCCLTPYRHKTKTGVNQLNRAIRKALPGEFHGYCEREDGMRIYAGDKVTYLRNNNGLVNGDTGAVVKAYKDTCTCIFGDKELTLTGEELSFIEPSFAQTVHKAQGQEYKTVIVICDEAHQGFMSRNLVYTSISRAKQKCICVGSRHILEEAILRDNGPKRFGLLAGLIGRE